MKHIYYLKWQEHSYIFTEGKDLEIIGELDREELDIYYGSRFSEEDLRYVKNSLKISIEKGVNRWISDSRFILHCIMSAGVFLVSYYFLSYVIRDPLPVIDEIVLSTILAVLAYFRLNNQEYKSDKALGRKLELEQSLADISCHSSTLISEVELYLEKMRHMNDSEQRELSESGGVPVFFSSRRKELVNLYKAINRSRRKKRLSWPAELKALMRQIRDYLKYHSSMV